jgi:hypothetical protein
VNLDNKKIYVGQTKNFDVRMGSHFNKSGQKSYIKRAIEKHGRERFVSVILLAGIEKQEEHINPVSMDIKGENMGYSPMSHLFLFWANIISPLCPHFRFKQAPVWTNKRALISSERLPRVSTQGLEH